jgi:hypothetical protein
VSDRVDEPAVPRPMTPRPSPALGLSADEIVDIVVEMMVASHMRAPTAEQVEEAHGRTYLTLRFLMEELAVARGLVTEDELDADEGISFVPDIVQGCVGWMDDETWERFAYWQQAPHRAPDAGRRACVPERVDLEGVDREKALGVDPDELPVNLELPEGHRRSIELREAQAEIGRATKGPGHGRFIVRSY